MVESYISKAEGVAMSWTLIGKNYYYYYFLILGDEINYVCLPKRTIFELGRDNIDVIYLIMKIGGI